MKLDLQPPIVLIVLCSHACGDIEQIINLLKNDLKIFHALQVSNSKNSREASMHSQLRFHMSHSPEPDPGWDTKCCRTSTCMPLNFLLTCSASWRLCLQTIMSFLIPWGFHSDGTLAKDHGFTVFTLAYHLPLYSHLGHVSSLGLTEYSIHLMCKTCRCTVHVGPSTCGWILLIDTQYLWVSSTCGYTVFVDEWHLGVW